MHEGCQTGKRWALFLLRRACRGGQLTFQHECRAAGELDPVAPQADAEFPAARRRLKGLEVRLAQPLVPVVGQRAMRGDTKSYRVSELRAVTITPRPLTPASRRKSGDIRRSTDSDSTSTK
jgi:hypothetical protein